MQQQNLMSVEKLFNDMVLEELPNKVTKLLEQPPSPPSPPSTPSTPTGFTTKLLEDNFLSAIQLANQADKRKNHALSRLFYKGAYKTHQRLWNLFNKDTCEALRRKQEWQTRKSAWFASQKICGE